MLILLYIRELNELSKVENGKVEYAEEEVEWL